MYGNISSTHWTSEDIDIKDPIFFTDGMKPCAITTTGNKM
jgi:hypothetical protein